MGEITDPATLAQLNATGGDFLKQLQDTHGPGYAALVKATAEGASAAPTGMALKNPFGQQLTQDVYQYDPTADAVNLPARKATRTKFTSGTQGQNITSFNTALGHLDTLAQAAEDLHNRSYPMWNSIANTYENATGDPSIAKFNVAKQAVVEELGRAFKGAAPTVHDSNNWEGAINSAQSPAQLRTAIKQAAELLQSRIGAMRDSYNAGMGTTDQPLPMLNEHAQEALQRFQSKDYLAKGYAALAGGVSPTPPPPGTSPTDSGTPPTPGASSLPGADPNMPSGGPGSALVEAPHAVPAEYQQFQKDLESGINGGFLATPEDAVAYMKRRGFWSTNPAKQAKDMESVKATFDYIAHGGKASVATPVAETPQALDATGTGVANFGNALTFGTLPKLGAVVDATTAKISGDDRGFGQIYDRALDANNATLDQSSASHPLAALGGNVAGFMTGDGVLGAVPGMAKLAGKLPSAVRPLIGDALYGGAYGIGSSEHLSDIPANALFGAGLAGAGGVLGRSVVRGAAAVASPVANAAVRRLTAAGVTMTPGQILGAGGGIVGRLIKGIEDGLTGFPVIGDVINSTRRGGVEDFNRKAINDALTPIGAALPGDVAAGHGAVAHARQSVSDAYDASLAHMTAVHDAQLSSDLRAVARRANTLSSDHREQLGNILDADLQPYLNGRSQLDGSDLQAIKQGMDRRIANLSGQGASPQDRELGDRLGEVRDAVLDAAGRSNPAAASDFAAANRAHSMLSRVEYAAAKAKDGVFTPNQFRQAVTKRGYGTTTAKVAQGDALMQQLATDASTILPSSVADSGTAKRALLSNLALGATGAGVGALGGDSAWGAGGALTGAAIGGALFSRPGARIFQKVVAGSRGRTLNTLGDILRANASLGGAVGTPLLLDHGR